MLAGEPGIGKTRLTEELTKEAASHQVRVLWGRCWEGGGAPAYWPWIQALREAIRSCESTELVAARSWLQYIARMLPELQSSLPEGEFSAGSLPAMLSVPGQQNDPEPARFRLFDCITNFLRLVAANPLMLALDDIHSADADSLLLLSFFARSLRDTRIIVVATYRDVEAEQSRYDALLKEIEREGICIPLRGLAESEVAEFVQCNTGVVAENGLVSALHQATGGNPFFLDETVRLMIADRTSPRGNSGNEGFAIPEGVRAATRRRLAPITETSRRVLTIASVIGYEFDLDLLAGLSQLTREQLMEALSEAASHRVIREVTGTYGRYRFNHAIIAEVLRSDVGRTELIRLHRRVAESLEDLHQANLRPYFARLAHHYLEALPEGPVDKAVNYARLGAESARTQLAYTEAARLYHSALLALEATAHPDEALRCEVLLGLGEAESKAGTREEAYRAFRRAADIARSLGRTDLLARAALAPGMWAVIPGTVDVEWIALIEEALRRVEPQDSALRALLLARLATELYWTERREAALSLVREGVEVARRIDDRSALVSTLWTQYRAQWGPDGAERRLEAATEMVALAQNAGDQDWLLKAHELKIAALVELGDVQKADYEIAAYEKLEKDSGQASGTVERFRAMRALATGEFQEAERLSRLALAIAQRRQEQIAIMSVGGQLTWLSYERGTVGDWIPALKAQATESPALMIARCALALFYLQIGDLSSAKGEFEYFAAHDFTRIPRDWNWMGAITALATVCAGLSDARRAAVLYQLLLPYADRNIMVGWADMCYGSASHHLGLLATTLGHLDDSQAHFEAAIEFDLKMGARAALLHTQVSYAAMLLARGRASDSQRALEMAKSARDLAYKLGMNPLVREASDLEARAQGSGQPPRGEATRIAPVESGRTGRMLATIMFLDIVESTARAAQVGDHRWGEQMREYYAEVRRHLVSFGGREINTFGDDFFALFDAPAKAVRCACAIRDAMLKLGLKIRAGVHTGECELDDGKITGIAVHIGARMVRQAEPGEVAVSSTVRDLVVGAGIGFDDRGNRSLKGVPGEWRVFVAKTPSAETGESGEQPEPEPNLFRRERDFWTVNYDGKVSRIKNMRGLGYLAHLLQNPGSEFHAVDLIANADLGRTDGGEFSDRSTDTKDRRAASTSEKAGLSVTRAIRAAIQRIADSHPALGRYLSGAVKTGRYCSYRPDSGNAIRWKF